jgi:hypothetical protein
MISLRQRLLYPEHGDEPDQPLVFVMRFGNLLGRREFRVDAVTVTKSRPANT